MLLGMVLCLVSPCEVECQRIFQVETNWSIKGFQSNRWNYNISIKGMIGMGVFGRRLSFRNLLPTLVIWSWTPVGLELSLRVWRRKRSPLGTSKGTEPVSSRWSANSTYDNSSEHRYVVILVQEKVDPWIIGSRIEELLNEQWNPLDNSVWKQETFYSFLLHTGIVGSLPLFFLLFTLFLTPSQLRDTLCFTLLFPVKSVWGDPFTVVSCY